MLTITSFRERVLSHCATDSRDSRSGNDKNNLRKQTKTNKNNNSNNNKSSGRLWVTNQWRRITDARQHFCVPSFPWTTDRRGNQRCFIRFLRPIQVFNKLYFPSNLSSRITPPPPHNPHPVPFTSEFFQSCFLSFPSSFRCLRSAFVPLRFLHSLFYVEDVRRGPRAWRTATRDVDCLWTGRQNPPISPLRVCMKTAQKNQRNGKVFLRAFAEASNDRSQFKSGFFVVVFVFRFPFLIGFWLGCIPYTRLWKTRRLLEGLQ